MEGTAGPTAHGQSDRLRLQPGLPEKRIDVALGITEASLAGKVDAEEAAAGKAGVVLQSLDDATSTLATVDRSGQFAFTHVPPGRYRLLAWHDMREAEYRNASVLAREKKNSREVHLGNDSHLSDVELPLLSQGR